MITPLYLQRLGVPIQKDRQLIQSHTSPGVLGHGDYRVTAAGGMTIAIAVGGALVAGTDPQMPNQGEYPSFSDTVQNVVLDPSDPVNPRIEKIYLHVVDGSVINTAEDDAKIEVAKGAPAAGAQANNPSGANYLAGTTAGPNTGLLLAYVVVRAGTAAILSTDIIDARAVVGAANHRSSATVKDDAFQVGVTAKGGLTVNTPAPGGALTVQPGNIWIVDFSGLLVKHNLLVPTLANSNLGALPAAGHSRIDGLYAIFNGPALPPTFTYVAGVDQADLNTSVINQNGAGAAPVGANGGGVVLIKQWVFNGTAASITPYDRRPWAAGASAAIERVAGNYSVFGTASNAWVRVDSTNLSFRIEVGANSIVEVGIGGTWYTNATNVGAGLCLFVDGIATAFREYSFGETSEKPLPGGWRLALSQGSHLIQLGFGNQGGGTWNLIIEADTNHRLHFWVKENINSVNNNNGNA